MTALARNQRSEIKKYKTFLYLDSHRACFDFGLGRLCSCLFLILLHAIALGIGAANQLAPATWSLSRIADLAPGTYVIRVTVTDDESGAGVADSTVVVAREDACTTYAGPLFVSTPSIKDSVATVELRGVIRDITAVTPGADPDAGNITPATVTFVNRDNSNSVIAANVPVSLLDPADPKTGTAVYNWRVDLGSMNSATCSDSRILIRRRMN